MKNASDFIDLLEEDLYDFQNNIAKYAVGGMADDLTKECKNAIELFYSHYNPEDPALHGGRIYYRRHWNFKKSSKRYYKNREPRYIGGVELLIDSIPNVYKGDNSDPKSVFERVYDGYHGIASFQGRAPIMNPSPIEIIMDKYEEIFNNKNKYFDNAVKKALTHKYNILS